MKIAAIVPAYNEANTLGAVLSVLNASPSLNEVIIVDDGSTDATARVAEEAGARVIRVSKNLGKGNAMREGVLATDAEIVVFFDADLRGLIASHIETLLAPVRSGERSMNVGLRDRGSFVTAMTANLPIIGGERAMKRTVFERVPKRFLQGFMVESALNYRCRADGLSYGAVVLQGLSIKRKYEKVGWLRAIPQYVRMFARVAYAMIVVRLANLFGRF